MYNPDITDQQLWQAGKDHKIKLVRYDDSRLEDMLQQLDSAVIRKDKWGFPVEVRTLTPTEKAFIKNERLVCKYDFPYYFTRYCHTLIKLEGRPVVIERIKEPLEPQKMFMEYLSRKEKTIEEAKLRGEPLDGYLVLCCKARQEGYTTMGRALTTHRVFFWEDSRALAASVDEVMVQELYDRDHEIYDHLPWWLKPSIEYDAKSIHLTFGKMGSKILYAQATQKGGLGMGKTIPINHITELGNWDVNVTGGMAGAESIFFDLEPTWPQAPETLVVMESTSNGRGNTWHQVVTASREGRTRYDVIFCPFYAEPRHNRKQPPEGWQPLPRTIQMIETAERTSPSYMFGKKAHISAEQAYWWESEYEAKRRLGRTAYFLTNYPTTLEESFQVSGNRAFTVEAMDAARAGLKGGIPYKFYNTQQIGKIQ